MRVQDSMYLLEQAMKTMGGDPQDFPYDQWGGMPRTEQEIDRLRQRIVD